MKDLSAAAAVGSIKTLIGGVKEKIGSIKESLSEKRERRIAFHPYTPVSSKNIAGMEYSDKMLKVTFKHKEGDREYGYDVEPEFFKKMEASPSKGQFLWNYLRGKTPGFVIDNPAKITPGGVGGSIVPYTKLSKRAVSPKEFKTIQKEYAKLIEGKVKVISKVPFVKKKEQKVSKSEAGDFAWITVRALSDNIPVKGHYAMRGGKRVFIKSFERTGSAKEEIIAKAKKLKKSAVIGNKKEESGKEEKKAPSKEPSLSGEQKRRKEIDKQARGIKTTKSLEPREEAIQKLIEETGLERERAEKIIAKKMGLAPAEAKKLADKKANIKTFQEQNKLLFSKISALSEINKKIQSAPLKNVLTLFLKAIQLAATGKDPKRFLTGFADQYMKIKKATNLRQEYKSKLLSGITQLEQEIKALAPKTKEDAITYISPAVDACAKEKISKTGQKGNYDAYVRDCVRMIGIARRKAGLQPRSGGTRKEVSRKTRREGTEERRERISEGAARRKEALETRQRREQYIAQQERRKALESQQDALFNLRSAHGRIQRYMGEKDWDAVQTKINLSYRYLRYIIDEPAKQEWGDAIRQWQTDLDAAKEANRLERERAEARIRELAEQRRAREERETRRAGVRERRQARLQESSTLRRVRERREVQVPEPTTEEGRIAAANRDRAGYRLARSAHFRDHPSGQRVFVRPIFRELQSMEGGGVEARVEAESQIESTSARQRRQSRRHRGQKFKWVNKLVNSEVGGRPITSLSQFDKSKWRSGDTINFHATAKKLYRYEDPDARNNMITLREGQDVGGMEFNYHRDNSGKKGLYLSYLIINRQARGRGATKALFLEMFDWVQRENLDIHGHATPISREREVAPAGLTTEQRRDWSRNHASVLANMYIAMGAVPISGEASSGGSGGFSMVRYADPVKRREARAQMLSRKSYWESRGLRFDFSFSKKESKDIELIKIKDPLSVFSVLDKFIYYDAESDQIFELAFEKAQDNMKNLGGYKIGSNG